MTDSMETGGTSEYSGPIAWMTRHTVAANLLMILLLVGGYLMTDRIKEEVFPEFSLDIVTVTVVYPGASPEEVENGIVLPVEEAVRGMEGIDEVNSTANEGSGDVRIELTSGADRQKLFQDIEQEINRIRTFPDGAEEPTVKLVSRKNQVLDVGVYGNKDRWTLRKLAETVRDRLLKRDGIRQVELEEAPDYVMHVEVPQETLRAHSLTLGEIAQTVARSSQDIPGGDVNTESGELLLRVQERKIWAEQIRDIPIISESSGSRLTLADLGTVRDGFEEADFLSEYNGKPTMDMKVYRVGDQSPTAVSSTVREAMDKIGSDLPPGVNYRINRDRSEIYYQRMNLLLKNSALGLLIVICVLGLFLEIRLAFWVMMGIPISFLGALLFMPVIGVSINMISMFAFLIALGIVVDDAIVVGENIYEYRERGKPKLEASIDGAQDMVKPVTFSIITNCVAFSPMLFIPGVMGKFLWNIPAVVITIFLLSLVEAFFILPAHLAHISREPENPVFVWIDQYQQEFSRKFKWGVENYYRPLLNISLQYRYLTLVLGIVVLGITVGYVMSPRMPITFMPDVPADATQSSVKLLPGSPMSKAKSISQKLTNSAQSVIDENGGNQLSEGIDARILERKVDVTVYLRDPGIRPISTEEFTRQWRERTGTISGIENIKFDAAGMGPGGGPDLTVDLSHPDIDRLEEASEKLANRLEKFTATRDVDDGFSRAKPQLDYKILPEGRSLGLTPSMVGRQVRNSFYGSTALRHLRGRNEVELRVKLPEDQRTSEYFVNNLVINPPQGGEIPLRDVAEVKRESSYTSIKRRDGRRTITVTSDVESNSEISRIVDTLKSDMLPDLVEEYPELAWAFEGEQAERRESMQGLFFGFLLALGVIYALLAIPFRSYVQPVVVMAAIPFGIIGAVVGHLIMGYNLSLISFMGIIALSGVVVNDSLIMVDYANKQNGDLSTFKAIEEAGVRRFRPILLTTFTTFGGLAPMILESSRQAQFIVPMAVSLGFGIVFATAIILLIVPCLYLGIEDIVEFFGYRQA